ncbi:hypothetical protein JCM8547_005030 [Rhodosporidiobolus lusitaniae]
MSHWNQHAQYASSSNGSWSDSQQPQHRWNDGAGAQGGAGWGYYAQGQGEQQQQHQQGGAYNYDGATAAYFPEPSFQPYQRQQHYPAFDPYSQHQYNPSYPPPPAPPPPAFNPTFTPNPAAPPFQPSFPTFAPFQPSWTDFAPYGNGNWSGGGRGGWGGQGNRGGGDPWSTGEYRSGPPAPRGRGKGGGRGGYRNQHWHGRRDEENGPSEYRDGAAGPSSHGYPSRSQWDRSYRDRSPSPPPHNQYQPRSFSHSQKRGRSRSPSPGPYPSSHTSFPSSSQQPDPNQPDQGYLPTPRYDASGSHVVPARRQKKHKRVLPVFEPTKAYMQTAEEDVSTEWGEEEVDRAVEREEEEENRTEAEPSEADPSPASRDPPPPPIVILDLNHTLLCRAQRSSFASRQPLVRPYLSTFLTYLCSSTPLSGAGEGEKGRRSRFHPIVFSSARAPNVLSMLSALSLLPPSRLTSLLPLPRSALSPHIPFSPHPYTPREEEGDVLKMVVTREMMGLSEGEYRGDVETVKDLGRVWEEMGWGGLRGWKEENRPGLAQRGVRERKGAEAEGETVEGEGEEGGEGNEEEKKKGRKKLTPKWKARFAEARDRIGARRTILLDDEASKAAQHPHSHLPLHPFLVPLSSFPSLPSSPPPPPQHTSTQPLELPSPSTFPPEERDSPEAQAAGDTTLLATVYELSLLRLHSNISYALRQGFVAKLRTEVRRELEAERDGKGKEGKEGEDGKEVSERDVDERLAQKGREVCEKAGVEVRREWDKGWREKVIEGRRRMEE